MNNIKKNEHKSNSWIFLLLIYIATSIMGIGYAQITPITSEISGRLIAEAQEGIFITDFNYSKDNNADLEQSQIIACPQTTLNSKIVLSDSDAESSITYSITVYNDYNISFSFIDTIYTEEFYDNENIVFELTNLNVNDMIPSKGYLTFEITFKYKDGVTPSTDINELNSYLNFKFLHPVKYIESSGTQYIDTGIKPDNNTTFEMSFSLDNVDKTQAIYGTRPEMDSVSHNIFFHNQDQGDIYQIRWDENLDRTYVDLNYNEGKEINIVKDADKITFTTNGKSVSIDNQTDSWSLDNNVYIFTMNQQSTEEVRRAEMKLYYLKMYQNGELVRDYTPVLDENSVPCLHDMVTNSYFYNKGTGVFSYSESFDTFEYIESSGTQYIDTGIKADSSTEVRFVMALNEVSSTTQGIFGGRDGQVNNTFNMFLYKSTLRWDYNTSIDHPSYSTSLNNPTYICANATSVTVNAEINNYNYTDTFNSNYNMHIFSVNDAGNISYLNTGMKIYYFKIMQNGKVVRNFIPAKDPSGVACLFDFVSEGYYYNQGTGSFNIK